jgi:glycosyltransferase involved in cell wall biosynthesis
MLAILSTHPIQYQVPLWQALAKDGRVPFEVWYLSDHATRESFDSEFKQSFAWDLDMLSGYPSRFLKTNDNADVARFGKLRLREPLSELMRTKKVKALWIQGWQVAAYWQAARQAHAAGIPVWLRGESNDLAPVALWKKPIKQIALRYLFSKVSHFLYIGRANRRFYKNFGVSDERLHPAYYCVDNERFKKQADEIRPEKAEIRRALGIPQDSFCILFAGKFIPKKRPMDLINATADLEKRTAKRIHLLFAGSGELGEQLRSNCKVVFDAEANPFQMNPVAVSTNGCPAASFTGFLNQTEISKAYIAADCLLLPSDYRETWGLVVNEAMASGLPCVVSDSCGCAEDLVRPIDPDLCFPVGNVKAICNALASLSLRHIEQLCLESQVARFDFSACVETVNKLYRDG